MVCKKRAISAFNSVGCVLGASLLAMSAGAAASQTEWVHFTENIDGTRIYSGKAGSYETTTNKAGLEIALVLGQIESKVDKTVTYERWYVSTADCKAGIGKLVALTVGGDYKSETEYVSKGNNIASGIGDAICSIYRAVIDAERSKGV
jgi:hypothetical protein